MSSYSIQPVTDSNQTLASTQQDICNTTNYYSLRPLTEDILNRTATASASYDSQHLQQIAADDSDSEFMANSGVELRGYLSKWTNYIYGWQPRYIVLKDGTLSYYKSETESDFGCRGAISLSKATIKVKFLLLCFFCWMKF